MQGRDVEEVTTHLGASEVMDLDDFLSEKVHQILLQLDLLVVLNHFNALLRSILYHLFKLSSLLARKLGQERRIRSDTVASIFALLS